MPAFIWQTKEEKKKRQRLKRLVIHLLGILFIFRSRYLRIVQSTEEKSEIKTAVTET